MSRPKTNVDRRRLWRLSAGYVFGIAVVVFAARHLGMQWDDVGNQLNNLSPWSCVIVLALFTCSLFLNALAFVYANRAVGVRAAGGLIAGTWLSTVLAKYLPIGIGHVIGRGVLLARNGVPVKATGITGVIEQSLSLLLCAWIAAVAWSAMAGSVLLMSLALSVPAGLLIVGLTAVRTWASLIVESRAFWLSAALYALAMVPFFLGYAVLVFPASWLDFAFAIFGGTLAGAAAIFVPGGVGVREAATAALSVSADGPRMLSGLVVARLLVLFAECVGTGVGARLLVRSGARS